MASTTFSGPVTSTNGFIGDVTGATLGGTPVDTTASTLAVVQATHAGRTLTLNRAGGIAVTLPAASGTGAIYRFIVGTTFSSAGTIKVANTSDIMTGTAILFADGGDTVLGFATAADTDTITLDGSTTGGIKGAHVVITDAAVNLWHVHYVSDASGTEATPFSATV